MSVLLDTHAALWYALGDPLLSSPARLAIETEPEKRFISPASYWEIAIKVRLRAYSLIVPFEEFWKDAIDRCSYSILPVEIAHAAKIIDLPPIHKDPFDRMIVAQALVENIPLVSCDAILDGYKIDRIW